jgi:hypothetical protein
MISSVSVPRQAGDHLTDADLRKSEIKLNSIKKPAAFVPAIPVAVVQAVVQARAEKALPLILAIHRQLQMTKRKSTPINAAVWETAGNPTVKRRAAILNKLKGVPAIILVQPERTPVSYYRAARGPLWHSP